jgi:hypothetical protein
LGTRDWMQIRTELDELRPDDVERQRELPTNQNAWRVQPPSAEDNILKHIADALGQDEAELR